MASEVLPAPSLMLPREHGAWSMLAVSYAAGLALAGGVDWASLPAAGAVFLAFSMRDPLVIAARGRAEAAAARRTAITRLLLLAICGGLLLFRVPLRYLLPLGVAAGIGLLVAVRMTVRNRQRSVWLQAGSAAGLSAAAVVAWLSVRHAPAPDVLWLWAALSAHSIGAILVVHARLEARIQARQVSGEVLPLTSRAKRAIPYLAATLVCGAAVATTGRVVLAAALLLSAGWHLADIASFRGRGRLNERLQRVGWRAFGLSLAFAALALAGLR